MRGYRQFIGMFEFFYRRLSFVSVSLMKYIYIYKSEGYDLSLEVMRAFLDI